MFDHKAEAEVKEQILAVVEGCCGTFHNRKGLFKEGDGTSYASRVHDHHEIVSLVDSAPKFQFTPGRFTDELEKKLADYLGTRFCSLVNSGSSISLVAFMTLASPLPGGRRVKRGDEVITMACGFPTTVAPVLQYGAVSAFVDMAIPQYDIGVAKLGEAFSDKTEAMTIAHTPGNSFDLRAVKFLCERHNLWLVEGSYDAPGSRYAVEAEGKEQTRLTGTIGDIGAPSFHPPHHMAMREGGTVYTDSPLLNKIIRSLRDRRRDCVYPSGRDNMYGYRFDKQFGELPLGYDHKYVYSCLGYNPKAIDMQASIGCAQIERFPSFVERRHHNSTRLKAGLKGLEDRLILSEAAPHSEPSWFGLLIICRGGVDRNQVVRYVKGKGVQTRMLFAGNLTKHSCFDEMRGTGTGYRIVGELANMNRIMPGTFWASMYPGMMDETVDRMAKAIREATDAQ